MKGNSKLILDEGVGQQIKKLIYDYNSSVYKQRSDTVQNFFYRKLWNYMKDLEKKHDVKWSIGYSAANEVVEIKARYKEKYKKPQCVRVHLEWMRGYDLSEYKLDLSPFEWVK